MARPVEVARSGVSDSAAVVFVVVRKANSGIDPCHNCGHSRALSGARGRIED